MSRWQELPAPLDQRVRQLVVRLRELKDHSGLSLAALAARTPYSKSSWERYLNGKKLPPRDAVEALARVCGTDPTRLLALQEVAAAAWEGRTPSVRASAPSVRASAPSVRASAPETPASAPPESPAPGPPGSPPGPPDASAPQAPPHRVKALLAVGLVAALLAVAAVLLVMRPWERGPAAPAAVAEASPGAFRPEPGRTFGCRVARTGAGALYAGHSTSDDAVLANGGQGWEVVEAQCLLAHHGYDPGAVDGIVGEKTMRAAKRLQAVHGLPADGIVGPDTWKVLRR
ncbi:helix-turn-helix domain-containing protein [Streptomyces sp. NPDC053542]|uniref:helix-turn-helix domain-containing protein n=1 Tax=Streptomyces sp. NPDC053542 TaxID=3365710 RepID=UPI0037D28B47